jgi:DNA-binding PadR family transcriptional regulator
MFRKRTTQTRLAIVGALTIFGDMNGLDIARAIDAKGGTLYPALAWLEDRQYIFSAWDESTGHKRRIYWLNPQLSTRRTDA